MFTRHGRFAIFMALLSLTWSAPGYSQSAEGRISGVVRDVSGAGVPGVTLTIANQATGATSTATSSTDGSYTVNIAQGVYSVTTSLKGFSRQSRKDLKVDPGAALTADFSLQAQGEEEVTVTATKREETLSNVPFSVAAPTEEVMRSRGIDSIEGVAANVAGFTVQNLGPGQSQVSMRGVSSGQIVRDQEVKMDGWNRIDAFNILGNPFTTTRPAVTLGERQQFTQIDEPFTDKFLLGDLNIRYSFGSMDLTSVTSYTDRDVLVVRDATALTASITGGSIGLPARVYTINAPFDDATIAKSWTQELRLSGERNRFRWVAGGFYSSTKRDYGQSLLVSGFQDATGIPTAGSFGAARDVLFFSDLSYNLDQFAVFGEGTLSVNDRFSVTAGARYYDFNEDRTQAFDGIFADPASKPGTIKANGVAPRVIASYKVTDTTNVNAQVSRGFRLGGINDQLNVPLCTREDLATFGGRDAWRDEKAWNYEIGAKSRVMDGRGSFSIAAFNMDITDLQATVTAGSCSSRVIFNVPKARSRGLEAEFAAAPNSNFDFSISGSFNNSELRSTLMSGGSVVWHSGGESSPERAQDPGGGVGHLPVADEERHAGLLERHLPTLRFALHPDRRSGDRLWNGESAFLRRRYDWCATRSRSIPSCRPTTS